MIDCLTSFIGLKRVNDSPTSSLYVNDLHGITTNQFDAIREIDENDGIIESWTTLESRAIRLFETDLQSNLKKYFKNYQVITSGVTGFVDDNTLADHGAGKYSGWLFDMSSYSPSLKIEINDIRIHLASAQNFNVKIFDANTGEELFTKAVTGIAGAQTVNILEKYAIYKHNKIFVCYDTVIPYRIFNDPSVPGLISQGDISTSSTAISTNINSSETGLAVAYNVRCSIEEFVCSRLALFTEPYIYKLGIEFLKESKYSEKINRYTLLDSAQKDELINDYTLEYQRQIDSVFEDLKVPDDGICFICNKAISKRVLIP
jgi:hypothetical protein